MEAGEEKTYIMLQLETLTDFFSELRVKYSQDFFVCKKSIYRYY